MIDERLILHRYKASSHAMNVGMAILGGFMFWGLAHGHHPRLDQWAVLGGTALTKMAFFLHFRRTN